MLGDGVFGGGPPPVFLCSLRNFDSSSFAVLCRFVHFSLTSATLVVHTVFIAVISCHTLCFNLLVVVLVNFDFSIAWFSSNFWVISAISCTEKFGFHLLQAFLLTGGTSTASSSNKEFSAAILLLKVTQESTEDSKKLSPSLPSFAGKLVKPVERWLESGTFYLTIGLLTRDKCQLNRPSSNGNLTNS